MAGVDRDFFELFQLDPSFDVDEAGLKARLHALQRHFHPDRFTGASSSEQRIAAQMAAQINAGYNTLKDPVRRAGYLLQRAGVDLPSLERQSVDGAFLMQQIELREQAQSVSTADAKAIAELSAEVQALWRECLDSFRQAYAADDLTAAGVAWLKLQYVDKLRIEMPRAGQ